MTETKDKHYVDVKGTKNIHDRMKELDKENFKQRIEEYFENNFDNSVECLEVAVYDKRQNKFKTTVSVLLDDQRPKETAQEANRINDLIAEFILDFFSFVTYSEHVRLEGCYYS